MEWSKANQRLRTQLPSTPLEQLFWSQQFANDLADDLNTFSATPPVDPYGDEALRAGGRADDWFNHLFIPSLSGMNPHFQSLLWERVLTVLKQSDVGRYEVLHKGTPFYFLGMSAYRAEDFERAVFYVDCGLTQDVRLHNGRWHLVPTGRFVRLDDQSPEQYGRPLVALARKTLDALGADLNAAGGIPLSIDAYRGKLVNDAIGKPGMRSLVTAFLSFILEAGPRLTQLEIAPEGTGTGEPFQLHLFKGALLFESLLGKSPHAVGVWGPSGRPPTLSDYLKTPSIRTALGLPKQFASFGVVSTFKDLASKVKTDQRQQLQFVERAIRTTWALRNATGHSLAIPDRPSASEYKQIFVLVFGAVAAAIDRLYELKTLTDGSL